MRIGIYGGSFDPVHYGHLLLAESAREQLKLDKVLLMPAATAPHKRGQESAPADARIEMLELAIGGHAALEISRLEIDRGGVSYTVDTLSALRAEHPGAELVLLVGGDTLADMPNWKDPEKVVALARIAVVDRPGISIDAVELTGAEVLSVSMPQGDLSSREIRSRVARGESIRYRLPRGVEQYILHAGLYANGVGSATDG